MNIKIEHIIFTPFCSNHYDEWKRGIGKPFADRMAMSIAHLETRVRYLESVCFPSIAAQYNQDFKWILAIDPDFPEHLVLRLEALIAKRANSFLHRVQNARWEQIEWLRPYISSTPAPTHLVTSNLDSDDGLDRRFTEFVRDFLVSRSEDQSLPPISILGYRDAVQWDLTRSLFSPYGWKSKWHRGNGKRILSPGYTVVAQYPEYPVLATGLRHSMANKILDFRIEDPELDSLYSMRRHACALSKDLQDDIESWPIAKTLFTLDGKLGLPLMLNHEDATQLRLTEAKPNRRRVWSAKSHPNIGIDWDRLWHDPMSPRGSKPNT